MRPSSRGLDTTAIEENGKYVYHLLYSSVLSLPVVCNVDATILLGGETDYFCTSNIRDVRLRSSGMLRSVDWCLVTDVSGQPWLPTLRVKQPILYTA